jgi:hypothetical protein
MRSHLASKVGRRDTVVFSLLPTDDNGPKSRT